MAEWKKVPLEQAMQAAGNRDHYAAEIHAAVGLVHTAAVHLAAGLDLISPSEATTQAVVELQFHLDCSTKVAARLKTLLAVDQERQEAAR